MTTFAPARKTSIQFRARSFVAYALCPEAPLDEWLEGLDRWTGNSPGFFAGRPIVLDINGLQPQRDLRSLIERLAERGIRVYALEGDGQTDLGPDLPPVLGKARAAVAPAARPDDAATVSALLVKTPVRSGQSIFHPHGDVVVLGSVGSGSEIVAGGSVHVYGALRGRVFAGANGNRDARIFCQKNEAEMLAVDGWYVSADDMDPASRGRAVQAFLEHGAIQIAAIN